MILFSVSLLLLLFIRCSLRFVFVLFMVLSILNGKGNLWGGGEGVINFLGKTSMEQKKCMFCSEYIGINGYLEGQKQMTKSRSKSCENFFV